MAPKHILILFCDQLRADCIGACGNEEIQTPAMDALVADSTVYNRCITPSPVCVPARLSLMSGHYAARHGNNNNNLFTVYHGKGFYHELTENGYQSCCVGKMHNVWDLYGPMGFSERHIQEELAGDGDDYTKYICANYPTVFDYNGQRSEMYYVPQVAQMPAEAHPTQWVGDRCVEFLEKCDPEKPVFLFGSFIHPHPPFCPPAPWNKLYRREGKAPFVPENYKEFKPLLTKNFDCDRLGISEIDALKLKNSYYACVSFVDYQMGRIIDTLKERGMYEDTLILLTSDHGEALGDYRNMGKRTMLDTAARVPFVMKVPGQGAGKREDVCSLVDVAPTLLSYAGVSYDPAEYDGVNLFVDRHEEVYSQYAGGEKGCYMVATATDKLVWNGTEQKYYYFTEFPEHTNRYEEMCESERVAALREKLAAHMAADVHQDIPAVKRRKINPFGVGRLDHRTRHDEELARIPAQYKIDLELPDKEPDGF